MRTKSHGKWVWFDNYYRICKNKKRPKTRYDKFCRMTRRACYRDGILPFDGRELTAEEKKFIDSVIAATVELTMFETIPELRPLIADMHGIKAGDDQ